MKAKNKFILIMVLLLLAMGLFYRLYGLGQNHSFWTDETQTAVFARAILQRGLPVLENGYTPTVYLPFWYYFPAFFMKMMGVNELAARLPSVIFGALTILAVFWLGKEMFNKNVGLLSALLVTFLKIEILWSRQARPYQLLQLLYLLAIFFFMRFLNLFKRDKKLEIRYFIWAIIIALLAAAIHPLGLLLFVYFFFYLVLFRWDILKKIYQSFNKVILGFLLVLLIVLLWQLNLLVALKTFFYGSWGETFKFHNHLYYYRVFLWQNYGLVSVLAFFGLIWALFKRSKINVFLVVLLVIHLGFISFRLNQPFVRYLYIIFPIFILLAAYMSWEIISKIIKKEKFALLVMIFLSFLLMAFNSKFALKPQTVYSLNEDMQEIPEVDYQKIYEIVKTKLSENPQAVYMANWNDHAVWYLGEGSLNYLLRVTSSADEKDPLSGAIFLKSLESLKEVIAKNPQGLILLESWESELPEGTRDFIRNNLKKEYEVDRLYEQQPRFWPVEIYSWGI
ncbi:hypothetical protein FJZ41_01700 [Candidatus Shapirobacteria bacterium]|nr:hypothetical protein [Candidatus Shapirobacteria bacterium]